MTTSLIQYFDGYLNDWFQLSILALTLALPIAA